MNLEAVCDGLVADARRDGEELRASAEQEATAAVRAATEEADRMVAAARAEGEAEARTVAAAESARARRQARELVLGAQRDVYERARAEVRRTASGLRHAPGYGALEKGLAELARRQLGPGAVVSVDEAGGVVASAGDRSVDYRLPVVAERCLAGLGADLEALWR